MSLANYVSGGGGMDCHLLSLAAQRFMDAVRFRIGLPKSRRLRVLRKTRNIQLHHAADHLPIFAREG